MRSALAVAPCVLAAIAPAAAAQTPLGGEFACHSHIDLMVSLPNDTANLEFSLRDADRLDTETGSTPTAKGVTVLDDLFAFEFDFGASAFDGEAHWLEFSVRGPPVCESR